MDDRKMPLPKSPFTEALKSDPHENARDAEKLYDAPDRDSVTEANRKPDRTDQPAGDPGSSANIRKPL